MIYYYILKSNYNILNVTNPIWFKFIMCRERAISFSMWLNKQHFQHTITLNCKKSFQPYFFLLISSQLHQNDPRDINKWPIHFLSATIIFVGPTFGPYKWIHRYSFKYYNKQNEMMLYNQWELKIYKIFVFQKIK